MTRTSAPIGPERLLSTGMTDKVEVNEQPERNAGYTEESIKSNTMSAVPQAQANSIRGMRKQQTDISKQEYEAQELVNRRKDICRAPELCRYLSGRVRSTRACESPQG